MTQAIATLKSRWKPVYYVPIFVLLLIGICITSLRVARNPGPPKLFGTSSRSDFEDYYQASRKIRAGEDPYHVEQLKGLQTIPFTPADLFDVEKLPKILEYFKGMGTYLYLPFTAYVLLPISHLDYVSAALIFQILSFFALLGYSFLFLKWKLANASADIQAKQTSIKEILSEDSAGAIGAIVISTVLLYGWILENAANGNIAFFLILLVAAGIRLSLHKNPSIQFLGGLLIGIASALKITPVFLVLFFFAYLRVMTLAGIVSGILMCLALPAAGLGIDRCIELTKGWYALILETYSKYVFLRPWANNQTISGAIGKLFLPGSDLKQPDVGLPLVSGIPDEAMYRQYGLIVKGINGLLTLSIVICSLVLAFRHFRNATEKSFRDLASRFVSKEIPGLSVTRVRMLFVVLLISLVTSGVSWYHAYSILLVPVIIRVGQRYDGIQLHLFEKIAVGVIAFFSLGLAILPTHMRDVLALYSVFTWASVIVVFLIEYLILRHDNKNGI